MTNTTKILILDANQRSSLAATRSLGRQIDAIIISADDTLDALAKHSRFTQDYAQYQITRAY